MSWEEQYNTFSINSVQEDTVFRERADYEIPLKYIPCRYQCFTLDALPFILRTQAPVSKNCVDKDSKITSTECIVNFIKKSSDHFIVVRNDFHPNQTIFNKNIRTHVRTIYALKVKYNEEIYDLWFSKILDMPYGIVFKKRGDFEEYLKRCLLFPYRIDNK